jgi:hypothetical protein
MIKKLRNQPYAPKWEQEEEEKKVSNKMALLNNLSLINQL